jgi:hypothetical protein
LISTVAGSLHRRLDCPGASAVLPPDSARAVPRVATAFGHVGIGL